MLLSDLSHQNNSKLMVRCPDILDSLVTDQSTPAFRNLGHPSMGWCGRGVCVCQFEIFSEPELVTFDSKGGFCREALMFFLSLTQYLNNVHVPMKSFT